YPKPCLYRAAVNDPLTPRPPHLAPEGNPPMPPKKKMTTEHKHALAKDREESRAVAGYLEALEANRPKRGRKRTPESIEKRVAVIEEQLPAASSIRALNLIQERLDLLDELDRIN